MLEVLSEALRDSALMLPWLFAGYLAVAFFERRVGYGVHERLIRAHAYGPLVGMLVGLMPQCGFSVVAAALYSERLITVGTLVAVLLATSDEAIPVLFSHPERAALIVPVLLGKMIIATGGGYLTDFVFRKTRLAPDSCGHDHQHSREVGCCNHDLPTNERSPRYWLHPVIHTGSIFAYFLAVSVVLGLALQWLGEARVNALLLRGSLLQPAVVGLVGLIPNCAVSVAIARLLMDGHLAFGSAMAGLCASGGLGLLVLAKESRSPRDVARIILILYTISVVSGILIELRPS